MKESKFTKSPDNGRFEIIGDGIEVIKKVEKKKDSEK
jgi:hypothetical protein